MNQILALREKRANLWNQTKAFLDSHRGEDGMVSAEDNATYEKMEADVVALGKEIEQPVAGQTTIRVLIKSSGGKVNIRTGNGTSYSRITAVAPGTTLEYVASAFNGWQAVKIGSQVGWVSGEYSEITSE